MSLIFTISVVEKKRIYNIEVDKGISVKELCTELEEALGCSNNQYVRLYQDQKELILQEKLVKIFQNEKKQIEAKIIKLKQENIENSNKQSQNNIPKNIYTTIYDLQNNRSYKFCVNQKQKIQTLIVKLQQIYNNNRIQLYHQQQILSPMRTIEEENIYDNANLNLIFVRYGG